MRLIKGDGESAIGYLRLNTHTGTDTFDAVDKQLNINDLVAGYKGPNLNLDFSKQGELIGIEIVDEAPTLTEQLQKFKL